MGIDNKKGTKQAAPNGHSKKNKIYIIFVAVAVIVIAALSATIIILLNREPAQARAVRSENYTEGGKGVVVTQDNIDEILAELNAPSTDTSYEVTMNTEWVFATADTPSKNAYVENVETNSRTVFFEVTLQDTGELVYTSPYLPLGSILRDFALDVELEAGEYNAVVKYYLVDDDYNEITDVSVTVKLTIER